MVMLKATPISVKQEEIEVDFPPLIWKQNL